MTKETKPVAKSEVTLFTNDYGVAMLEIKTMPRSTFISVNKAKAIIKSIDKPELVTEVEKYGRNLFKIGYGNGTGFTVGDNKLTAVFTNAEKILNLVG